MTFGPPEEAVDAATGEVISTSRRVLPSHYKCPQSGAFFEVENPDVWVYPEGSEDEFTHMSEA